LQFVPSLHIGHSIKRHQYPGGFLSLKSYSIQPLLRSSAASVPWTKSGETFTIDAQYVRDKVEGLAKDADLRKFIL